MKDEKMWDYSHCQIGRPCNKCAPECTFYIVTYSLVQGQDEKEKENERIFESTKGWRKLRSD